MKDRVYTAVRLKTAIEIRCTKNFDALPVLVGCSRSIFIIIAEGIEPYKWLSRTDIKVGVCATHARKSIPSLCTPLLGR